MSLEQNIKEAQSIAGENAVLAHLRKAGLLDKAVGKGVDEDLRKGEEKFQAELKQDKALRYNEGKLPWHLVDFRALEPMVRVLAYGMRKYSADNWKKGLSLTEIRDSFIRHMKEWNSGQEIDPESGESHIGHMMCNLLFYAYFTEVDSSKARD